jgi:hypothetical protein
MADELSPPATPPAGQPVRGREPTTRERALRTSIESLTPAGALTAVDEASVRLTSAVALTGAIAGGFGLVSAEALTNVGVGWAVPCLAAAGLSIALAVGATVPVRARLRPGDLTAMEKWYGRQIGRRVGMIRASAILLGVAVLTAALPTIISAVSTTPLRLSLGLGTVGDSHEQEVLMDTSATGLPAGATLEAILTEGSTRLAFSRVEGHKGSATATVRACARAGSVLHGIVEVLGTGGSPPRRVISVTVPGSDGARRSNVRCANQVSASR